MGEIWANRLIAGTKTWADMPARRKKEVREVLQSRVDKGLLTQEQYNELMQTMEGGE